MSYSRIPPFSTLFPRAALALGRDEPPTDCSPETKDEFRHGREIPIWPNAKLNRWLIHIWAPQDFSFDQIVKHIEYLFKEVWFSNKSNRGVGPKAFPIRAAQLLSVYAKTYEDLKKDHDGVDQNFRDLQAKYWGQPVWSNIPGAYDWTLAPYNHPEQSGSHFAAIEFLVLDKPRQMDNVWFPYFYPTYRGMYGGGKKDDWDCPLDVNTYLEYVYLPEDIDPCELARRYPGTKICTTENYCVTRDSAACTGGGGGGGGGGGSDPGGGGSSGILGGSDAWKWLLAAGAAGAGFYFWKRSQKTKGR